MSAERTLHADVGIVGAGPAGLAAANDLARAGLSVVILDEGQRPGGRGQSLPVLQQGTASDVGLNLLPLPVLRAGFAEVGEQGSDLGTRRNKPMQLCC